MRSTENYSDKIAAVKELLNGADCLIIGAGAGLSTSAGFTYSGERFEKYFSDFAEKYGITDMYSGGFYPFETSEEFWAWWSRMIYVNRYMDAPKPVYQIIHELVKEKDHFVITTNVDHCFQKAGFDKRRLFFTQGDYGLFQCSKPCCNETWDNEDHIIAMLDCQENMRIPAELVPKCPRCGRPLTLNLRSDDKFVEDKGWHEAARRYGEYLRSHEGKRILFLELGVGYNTPVIIKYPFRHMTADNPNSAYVCVNLGEKYGPLEIANRSVFVDEDIFKVISDLT